MNSVAQFLLPAIAVAILFSGLWTSRINAYYQSRKNRRRARARAMLMRFLVAALLLGTLLTEIFPLETVSSLVQGVLVTVALMTPVCIYFGIREMRALSYARRYGSEDTRTLHEREPDAMEFDLDGDRPMAPRKEEPRADKKAAVTGSTIGPLGTPAANPMISPLTSSSATSPTSSPASRATNSPASRATNIPAHSPATAQVTPQPPRNVSLYSQSGKSVPESDALDQTMSVSEQLETLDDLVDFHDIGMDSSGLQSGGESVAQPAMNAENPLEKAIAIAREAILDEPGLRDDAHENLPAKSTQELAGMVISLRSDKMKLQKLVIAQKVVIDAEKQAHEKTRVVVKDAISVMRHARHGQRIAEKIARRERGERQRLEKEVDKVNRALDNALSTLRKREEEVDL